MAIAIQRAPNLSSAEKLQNHYLEKHNTEVATPLRLSAAGIAIIVAVANAILTGYAFIPAAVCGLGIFAFMLGGSLLFVNQIPSINKKASEALKTPGFYEFAKRTPSRICSAGNIVRAHEIWLRS